MTQESVLSYNSSMKILIFIIITTSFSFAQSHQEAYCRSEALSTSMADLAGKVTAKSRQRADEFHFSLESIGPKERKSIEAKIENFEFTDICLDEDTLSDLDHSLEYKLKRKRYLDGTKEPNPIEECLKRVAPDYYWQELRRKSTKSLCEGLKENVYTLDERAGGLDCDISDLGIIDFKYAEELQAIKSKKKQCILYIKQVKDVVDTLKSK